MIGAATSAGALLDEDSRRLSTDRWVEIGSDGNATRYLARTTTSSGLHWQDQFHDGETELINFHARPGDGATCGEQRPVVISGSSLPIVTASELERIGFVPSTQPLPAEVSQHLADIDDRVAVLERAGRPGASHITNRVSFLAWHEETGQTLGQWNYGTLGTERILLDSYALTLFQLAPEFPSRPSALGQCEGGTASEPSGAGAGTPAQEISTATAIESRASR